jgi:hypothetical protein
VYEKVAPVRALSLSSCNERERERGGGNAQGAAAAAANVLARQATIALASEKASLPPASENLRAERKAVLPALLVGYTDE